MDCENKKQKIPVIQLHKQTKTHVSSFVAKNKTCAFVGDNNNKQFIFFVLNVWRPRREHFLFLAKCHFVQH